MKAKLALLMIAPFCILHAFSQSLDQVKTTYHSEKCGFSFSYPSRFSVQEKSSSDKSRCDSQMLFLLGGKVKHSLSLSKTDIAFDAAAEKIGLEKSRDGWVSAGPDGNAEEIAGAGWKGLSFGFAARCYGNEAKGYQGAGEGQIAFANAGNITLIIDGGSCEHSDPDAYQWIVQSLKFD
jgi:hypothetical protein